jgi:hypothetical protein
MIKGKATYQYLSEKNGRGTFFYTDCCHNRMYTVNNDPMFYHGKLCPKCFHNYKLTTLYLRGTNEAKEIQNGIKTHESE